LPATAQHGYLDLPIADSYAIPCVFVSQPCDALGRTAVEPVQIIASPER
jgi:hypothetical protein